MSNQRFFIYARKSTDDVARQIRSIPDQLAELRELAQKENLTVVDVLVEKQTAKMPGRPIFNEMLDRIEKGDASGILAWHPDRLARNSLDGGRIIYLVDTGKIADMRFPTYWFEPTSQGKFMLAIAFGQSKYYVDNLSENIRRGIRQKLHNGIWPHIAPLGYLNDKVSRMIVPDPERAPMVRKAFELHATGTYTLDRLHQTVNALGLTNRSGKPLSRSQYHRLLQNPIYYGVIAVKEEHYSGKHEPLITKDLFDTVQAVMNRKSKPKAPELKPYLYRGMFRCGECGCFITAETQKGHNYLRCTKRVKKDCSQRFVREEIVSEQVTRFIQLVSLPAATADWMITELQAEQARGKDTLKQSIESVRSQIEQADAKLNRLMAAYLDTTVSLEEFRQAKNQIIDDKRRLEDQIVTLEKNGGNWFEPAIRFINAAKQASILAQTGSPQEKRDFLRKNGSNLKIEDRTVFAEPRQAWKLVVDYGPFAHFTAAPRTRDAAVSAEKSRNLNLAETGRFELPEPFKGFTSLAKRHVRPL